jgi:serine/threonine protein kinase
MAPEQVEGQETDARTDIFAFGAVLYEMVTGRRAFEGESQATLIAAIISGQPKPIGERVVVSAALSRTLARCLSKDPDDRWQTARDLLDELRWVTETTPDAAAMPVVRGAEWIERAMRAPVQEMVQADGRIRRWAPVPEVGGKVLRVVLRRSTGCWKPAERTARPRAS